jgi:hypothetical protein
MNARTSDAGDNHRLLRLTVIGSISMVPAGSALHFVYGWSSQNALVGLFAPVNESIWEHAKLVFLPPLLWYGFTSLSAGRG